MIISISHYGSLLQQLPVLWQGTCRVVAALSSQARHSSVLSWGRNVEGQCGVEGDVPVVARPLSILNLHGTRVSSIYAGTLNSAAVLSHEEIYTWGDGASGKLGHGNGDSISNPSRVEAFVGRTAVTSVALGQHHSLFLGSDGLLWACGENKEGQCGFGLPLEALASRYRKAYYESIRPAAPLLHASHATSDRYAQYLRAAVNNGAAGAATTSGGVTSAGSHVAEGWGSLFGSSSNSRSSRSNPHHQQQQSIQQLFGLSKQQPGHAGAAATAGLDVGAPASASFSHGLGKGLFSGSSHGNGSISSQGVWAAADMETMLHSTRIHAGQTAIPARVAAEQSTLMGLALAGNSSSGGAVDATSHDSLEGQQVVGVSASKFFSLAVTDKGEVWAWGADYNGALGSEASWLGSAQRVAAPISDAVAAAGGAVAVAAGSTFSAALTAAGTVLVWGKLGGGSPVAPGLTAAASSLRHHAADSADNSNPNGMFAQVALPEGVRISSISAGQQHLLLTDGNKVWVIGRWLNGMGDEIGVTSWDQPHEVLSLRKPASSTSSTDRILKVVAGMHSSAAVTEDGRLWLWGRLLDEQRGVGIVRRFGGEKYVNGVDWGWAGFGGAEPRLVEGVGGVKDVALGGWHALVLVD